jgi:hypothetical protein
MLHHHWLTSSKYFGRSFVWPLHFLFSPFRVMRPNNRPLGNTDLRPKPVHNVLGETEGDRLWGGKDLALVEGHAEVDVDEVAGLHIDQDVVDVSIAKA